MRRSKLTTCLCAWLCLAGVICAAEAGVGTQADAFLIVDYLPTANYEGDGLSACFRIENASGRQAAFEITARPVDAAGKDMDAQVVKVTAAAGTFAAGKFDFETRRTARIAFELKRSGEDKVLAKTSAVLLREDDPWPATKIANGRLTLSSDGSIVIPLVQKTRIVEHREFALTRWLLGDGDDGADGGLGVAYAPASWRLNINGVRGLGPWTLDGSVPILNAVDRILSDLSAPGAAKVQRMAIVLPPEDLDLATDPRTYRMALDALLARLPKAGVVRTTLIAPSRYGCNAAHQKALWREIHESAAANSAKAIDSMDWSGEAQWRADPSTSKVFGPIPNADGRKRIEQAVAKVLK